jgi:hypothetical protein
MKMPKSDIEPIAKAGIVVGILLWLIGSLYAGFNGAENIISLVWITAWLLLPVAVGSHAGVTTQRRPLFAVGFTLVCAIPFLGMLPARYYLGYTTGGYNHG